MDCLPLGRMVEAMSLATEHPTGDFEANYRKWHTLISFWKSGIRIGFALLTFLLAVIGYVQISICTLAIGIFIAEILGVVEEKI